MGPRLGPNAASRSLLPGEPRSLALEALCGHLGRDKARGFVRLLWLGEPAWWQWHEWTKLQAQVPSLPAWDVATLRALFPATLVPEARSMLDLVPRCPLVTHVAALMEGRGDLGEATSAWLGVQRAHRIAILRTEGELSERWPTPEQIDEVLATLDAVAPDVDLRPTAGDWLALFDDAPLLVDASHFCVFDGYSHPYPDFGHAAWADQIDDWLRERARFGEPDLVADWQHGAPDLSDYVRWRDAWLAILDRSSSLIRTELSRSSGHLSPRGR